MPSFWQPHAYFENGNLITREYLVNRLSQCENHKCDIIAPGDEKVIKVIDECDENFETYSVSKSEVTKRWEVKSDTTGSVLASFTAPPNVVFSVYVFRNEVVVVQFIDANARNAWVVAYRADGKRADIAGNFAGRVIFDDDKIIFGVYKEGVKVLDTEEWFVKRYDIQSDVVGASGETLLIADRSWRTGPAVQAYNLVKRQSKYIPVPNWRSGIAGETIKSSAISESQKLLVLDSSGFIYVVDIEAEKFLMDFNSGYPYSNAAIKFLQADRLLVTYGADGFIRVWGVVPEGAPVR
jgi:hypothetical protein